MDTPWVLIALHVPIILHWTRRDAREKERAGRLELIELKEKMDVVLAKGSTPEAGDQYLT
jgi:hypothetical protein